MKIWLFFFFLEWMKPEEKGETQTRRPALFWSALLSQSAKSGWKPYMWNHFSPVRWLRGRTPWETKASSSIRRFPSKLCCSRCSLSELQIETSSNDMFFWKRKEIHRQIWTRAFCEAVRILTDALSNSAFPQSDFFKPVRRKEGEKSSPLCCSERRNLGRDRRVGWR